MNRYRLLIPLIISFGVYFAVYAQWVPPEGCYVPGPGTPTPDYNNVDLEWLNNCSECIPPDFFDPTPTGIIPTVLIPTPNATELPIPTPIGFEPTPTVVEYDSPYILYCSNGTCDIVEDNYIKTRTLSSANLSLNITWGCKIGRTCTFNEPIQWRARFNINHTCHPDYPARSNEWVTIRNTVNLYTNSNLYTPVIHDTYVNGDQYISMGPYQAIGMAYQTVGAGYSCSHNGSELTLEMCIGEDCLTSLYEPTPTPIPNCDLPPAENIPLVTFPGSITLTEGECEVIIPAIDFNIPGFGEFWDEIPVLINGLQICTTVVDFGEITILEQTLPIALLLLPLALFVIGLFFRVA